MTVVLIPVTSHGENTGNYIYDSERRSNPIDWYSDKAKADGYFGGTDGLHTVAAFFTDAVATITFQGSLDKDPGDDDWVDIDGISFGSADGSTEHTRANGGKTANFKGNFVWVRAKVANFTRGTIDKVQFNY